MTKRLGMGLAALLGLMLGGCVYESIAASADAKAYPPPGQLIDIGGYRLHIYCVGTGVPAVIIDAGLGDWSTSWGGYVQPETAKTTQVCTYDRAGMGWSEAGPLPRDARQYAKELHGLLQNANVHGPYVVVGHSLGGFAVRVFAHDFAPEVAGVVLIESMNPRQIPPSQAPPAESQPFSLSAALARVGVARLLVKLPFLAPAMPAGMEAYYPLYIQPKSLQTTTNEAQGMPAAATQAAAVRSLGDMPLIVLSAKLNSIPHWQDWQSELLLLSTNSQQLLAEHSGHNVQLDEPEAAIAAIVKMVELVRQTAREELAKED